MKALILAAGKGTRLRPLTNTIPKHLLPVANKPILYYILEQIRDADISDIGVVISAETGAELKLALGGGQRWGAKITYILQAEPLGLAHAVKTAKDFLADSPFLLFLGDNLIKDGVKGLVSEFDAHPSDAMIVLKEVADPRAFGVAETDASGKVTRVIEKPKVPKTNLALVGAYIFSPVVHLAIAQLQPSWRGEYEITDAIQKLLDMKKEVRSHVLQDWWLDTGNMEDLLAANRLILDEYLKLSIKGEVDSESSIVGGVEICEGAKIETSIIRGPVSIAAGAQITKSFIGPYSCIGAGTIIENSNIENSVILNNSHILDVQHLADSVIGRNVEIVQRDKKSEATRLFMGDYGKVAI